MQNKSIKALIDENYTYAKVLDYFGVAFHKFLNNSLEEVCVTHGVDLDTLIIRLKESSITNEKNTLGLNDFPAFLIIEYLKYTHQIFIKETLPYVQKLVDNLEESKDPQIISDLKLVMPMFIEEFIYHIYEEEDRLFTYVLELDNFVNGRNYSSKVLERFENFSIADFAHHHCDSDDEMAGIRGITFNYEESSVDDVSFKILMKELNAFDKELQVHARIENEILIPKALALVSTANDIIK